jgi:REP element-mobilizing transposase RayT
VKYFLTWTTYGTWLRGDERGWNRDFERGPGEEDPDPVLHADDQKRLKHPPTVLSDVMRRVVDQTIVEVAKHRGWRIGALSVRTNHVHVVVEAEASPEKVMNDFKSWSTRRLREAGLAEPEQVNWTKHGSTKYLNTDAGVRAAIDYVERFQDDRAGRFSGAFDEPGASATGFRNQPRA